MSKDEVINQLQSTIQELQNTIKELNSQLSAQNILIQNLQSQLDNNLRALYGTKSEKKFKTNQPKPVTPKYRAANSENKNKAVRKKLPEHLDREVIKYELAESERECKLCSTLCHMIGKEVSEQLEFVPAKLYVKEHRRYKYGCRHGCTIKVAKMPPQPIPKGIPGPKLLTEILINKYEDAMPLYRQLGKFKRHGIDIASSTMGDWATQAGELLSPLIPLMQRDLLRSVKLHTDDTPVPVLSKGKTKQSRLWVYVADGSSGVPCTIYDYSATRSQTVPQSFLSGYKGYLQADAFPGYDKLYSNGDVIEIGCLAHARRKFYDIAVAAKGETKASLALEYISKIYEIDSRCKNFEHIKRYYYRKKYLKPAYKRFYRWLNKTYGSLLGNTPIIKAYNYVLNHWRAIQNVFADGRLELDNNRAERAIKPVVIGRKNWLFAGSHTGGKTASVVYSLIASAKQNGLNTFDYLSYVIENISLTPENELYKLLPYNYRK